MSSRASAVFAVIPPGLEQVLVDELADLGVRGRAELGGVSFDADRPTLYRLHLEARTPVRFWLRMGKFVARTLDALAAGVRGLDWAPYVRARQEVVVRVSTTGSRLHHRTTIASKVQLAIRDSLRGPRRADEGRPSRDPIEVLVRIEDDQIEVSVDASGDRLHRRGWRKDTTEAPLRENLAAAVLWLAGWHAEEALLDPMCGSGTFPIEAATIASGSAPGADRKFAFEGWPSHDPAVWDGIRGTKGTPVPSRIYGSDRDAEAIRAATANARRAGVADRVELRCRAVEDLEFPASSGLIVANPPYGDRLRGPSSSWAALGRVVRERATGWRIAILVPDPALLRTARLRLPKVASFSNGGIRIALHVGDVAAAIGDRSDDRPTNRGPSGNFRR